MVHKAAHFHLQATGDFKIIQDLPSSHKGWKEKFVWVEGDDSNLDCSNWPEIKKGALGPKSLTSAEEEQLNQIISYTGPRAMEVLLNKSVLRLHGISSITPTKRDETRAHNVTFGGLLGLEAATEPTPSDEPSGEAPGELASASVKRPRDEVADEGVSSSMTRREAAEGVATELIPRPTRKWQKKTSHGPWGARRLGDRSDAPMEVESADRDDDLPPEPSVSKPASAPTPALGRVEIQPGTMSASLDEGKSRRSGKEPVGGLARGAKLTGWPSAYYLAESEIGAWTKTRDMMIGKLPFKGNYEEEPDPAHRFVPAHGLDTRSSVFESRIVQAKAVEQFSLPRDEEFLKGVPDLGLHAILRSYMTRGCLVEQELHRRLARGHEAYEKLQKASAGSRGTNDAELDRVVADLSVKQAELDNWRRELEVKEQMLAELKASDSAKSVEIQQLRQRLQRVEQESGSNGTISELLRERDRASAFAAMEKQIAERAKSQLDIELAGKKKLLEKCAQLEETLLSLRSRVSHLESTAHESAIVAKNRGVGADEFCHSPLGKLEAALACKAGCDYIMTQFPAELLDSPDRPHYPPIVANRIGLLLDMESAGHGYDVSEDREEDESSATSSQPSSGSLGGPKGDGDDGSTVA